MDEYKNIVEEYKKINADITNRVITLSITVIGAIFVICDKYGVGKFYLGALLGFILTIVVNFLNNIFKSKHYELVLDGKIKNIDFRQSCWGKAAEFFYWVTLLFFLISNVTFITALIISIRK